MAIIRFYCPNCGEVFPWFIARLQRSYSFFEGTKVKCSKCGVISRIKVSFWKALISWTLIFVLIWALLPSGAKHLGLFIAHMLGPLRDVSPGVYGALGGALGGLVLGVILGLTIGIGLRQGLEVVADKEQIGLPSRAEKIQKWAEAILPFALALGFLAYVFQRSAEHYSELAIVIVIALIIRLFIRRFGRKD